MPGPQLQQKTFLAAMRGAERQKVREKIRNEALEFVNKEVGKERLFNITEVRRDDFFDLTVWYWDRPEHADEEFNTA